MTDIAVVADHLARVADVLAVMTTKTTTEIKMADVIRMSLPVGPHLGEKISSKDSLQLGGRCLDVVASLRVKIWIVLRVKLIEARRNRPDTFDFSVIRFVQQRY